MRGDEIYIRCCNPVTKRDTVANFNYEKEKKKGKEKNILAEFFRNANQVLKLLDCRAINIPTRDLVSITSSHKTRVPLGSLEAVVNIYYLFRYNNLKQPLRNTL